MRKWKRNGIARLFYRYFGTYSKRELARAEAWLDAIREREKALITQSDAELSALSSTLRRRSQSESADALLIETFALVSDAARRTLGLRPFDVQILGGIAMHRGNIAEMKTGEGKTLVATFPAVLNAWSGRGVQVVTVNDYLAERDANWMGPLYRFLGLSVGVVTEALDPDEQREARKAAYQCDITYATNHELVFDYLRDNLAQSPDEVVGRGYHFAIVDETDFLLLDEARTPLIISGEEEGDKALASTARKLVQGFEDGTHFEVEPKVKRASFLEAGYDEVEKALHIGSLADAEHAEMRQAVHNALLALAVYQRDVDYIVEDDRIVIVDEFTGRPSPEKRYADGLHQALEAKEGVEIREEDITLAKISYQSFFRMYSKLSGMTGTAYGEREELARVYRTGVVRVPTHRPVLRTDLPAVIFRSEQEKFAAVVKEIVRERERGRPVLVGSVSVKDTERISGLLRKEGVTHQVLNAKHHATEAEIVAQAGQRGAVTISTNMAGRGTDIRLGDGVAALGGLAVIGTEWHESTRIDDQLRGRAGRQGDPGTSIFMVSVEDVIYKKFGKHSLPEVKRRLASRAPGDPVEDRSVRQLLIELRKKVEVENQAIRKEVFRYDLVIDAQRQLVYGWRRKLLEGGAEQGAWLRTIDELWTSHLGALESLDDGIGLRGYAERDPLVEYQKEAAAMFKSFVETVQQEAAARSISLDETPPPPPGGASQRQQKRRVRGA